MLKLTHVLLAISFFIALANAVFGQDSTSEDVTLDPVTAVAADSLDIESDESKAVVDQVDELADDNQATAKEAAAVVRSLIMSVRTNNGFTIHGIPTKPQMLPVNIYGSDVKVPWDAVSTVEFTENGGIKVALEDGSRLIGYSLLEFLDLEKEWGSVRVQRERLQSIHRTQMNSTQQQTFQSPNQPSQGRVPFGS